MKKARTLLTLGIWVAILPYLGFPSFIKNILFTLTGLGICFFSYVFYKEHKECECDKSEEGNHKKTFDTFSENNHFNFHKKTEKQKNQQRYAEEDSENIENVENKVEF